MWTGLRLLRAEGEAVMDWGLVVQRGLLVGLAHSLTFTVVVFAGLAVARDFMVHTYPPAIRERYGPKSARGRRMTVISAVLIYGLLATWLMLAIGDLRDRTGGDAGFLAAFVIGALTAVVWCAYDVLILDWLLFCTIQPRLFILPGTEGMPEYRDYRFHIQGALVQSTVFIAGVGLLTAAVTTGVELLI